MGILLIAVIPGFNDLFSIGAFEKGEDRFGTPAVQLLKKRTVPDQPPALFPRDGKEVKGKDPAVKGPCRIDPADSFGFVKEMAEAVGLGLKSASGLLSMEKIGSAGERYDPRYLLFAEGRRLIVPDRKKAATDGAAPATGRGFALRGEEGLGSLFFQYIHSDGLRCRPKGRPGRQPSRTDSSLEKDGT